jgi:hypothetical protein
VELAIAMTTIPEKDEMLAKVDEELKVLKAVNLKDGSQFCAPRTFATRLSRCRRICA